MELYILSKQDLSILSICKLSDYQINLDEETNAKSTFTLMKTEGLKKDNFMVLNGLYRQFLFIIDDVQTEKGSDAVTVTALDISNIFDRKVIEKNTDTMTSKSIEEFIANTMSENFVNSDDTALNVGYIDIYWHTNTQGTVATNAENGLYNFHTFLTNCRQYRNIYIDFRFKTTQIPTGNKFNYMKASNVANTFVSTYRLFEITGLKPNTQYTFSGYDITSTTTAYIYLWSGNTYADSAPRSFISSPSSYNTATSITFISNAEGKIYLAMYDTTEAIWNEFIQRFKYAQVIEVGSSELITNNKLQIDIAYKEETTALIDTTLPEVTDYNKIYEGDVTAKVQVYIREDGSEYNLYLKTDRTTTTNKDDPDRASGKIEVISVDTADRAPEEALNVMKGNNYKHLVEFKIAKTSKLMDITKLHIGRPIRIKTDDDIYDSYISAITLSDENFVYFKSGSLRITLLDKLKASNSKYGNKLDITGGKILGNLNILDNAYFGENGVAFGMPYDEDEGGPLQLLGKDMRKNIAVLTSDSRPTITISTAYTEFGLIPLDTLSTLIGNKLTYSNNGIKIGKGVSRVKVSAQVVFWRSTDTRQLQFAVLKNGKETHAMCYSNLTTGGGYITQSIVIASEIIDVMENDILTLNFASEKAGNFVVICDSTHTKLYVEVVE